MTDVQFLSVVARIIGQQNAILYSRKIGDELDADFHKGIFGYEALAFHVYSTATSWHVHINQELWSGRPSRDVRVFVAVLNSGIRKLVPYKTSDGLVFRGLDIGDRDAFAGNYRVGSTVTFHGFTRGIPAISAADAANPATERASASAKSLTASAPASPLGRTCDYEIVISPASCLAR